MPKGENITTSYKIDISDLKKGISEANKQIKLANAEFKAASAGMDDWRKSTDGVEAKLKQLNSVLSSQKSVLDTYRKELNEQEKAYSENGKRVEELKAKLKDLADNGVEKASKEYKEYESALRDCEKEQERNKTAADNLKYQIQLQETAVEKTENEIGKYNKALDDLEDESKDAKAETDKFDKSLEDIDKSAKDAKDGFTTLKGAVSTFIGNLATKAVEAAADAIKKLGKAAVDTGKKAIQNYAEYEQLVGGVETLFKDAAKEVQKNADKAYKTAGMSANKYMDTVTSFSASLIQSLGKDTKKAARYADLAIRDMSDNANKMGTDVEAIQNAYKGFAKQTYNMLDNLKLGYGGSQQEMYRLLQDAAKLDKSFAKTAKFSLDAKGHLEVGFADIVQAIHIVQTDLDITGTTAKEASSTISGSIASLKAAWENLLTGIANEQVDKEQLVNNLTESLKTVAQNLIPVIESTIKGMIETAEQLLNELMGEEKFDFDAEKILENLKDAIKKVVEIFMWFIDNKELVIGAIEAILGAFVAGKIIAFAGEAISAFTSIAGAIGTTTTAILGPAGLAIAITATLIPAIAYLIDWFSSEEEAIDRVRAAQEKLTQAQKDYAGVSKTYAGAVDNSERAQKQLADAEKKSGISGRELSNQVIRGTIDYKNMTEAQREVYKYYLATEEAASALTEAEKKLAEQKNEVRKAEAGLNNEYFRNDVEGGIVGGYEIQHGQFGDVYYGKKRISKRAVGGVLKKGEIGLLEGTGAEAVVPLDRNKYWIKAVANDMLRSLSENSTPRIEAAGNTINNSRVSNFTQNIYAPQQPSRIELYRQTRNLLDYAKVGGA